MTTTDPTGHRVSPSALRVRRHRERIASFRPSAMPAAPAPVSVTFHSRNSRSARRITVRWKATLAVRRRLGDISCACWGATGRMAEVVYFACCGYVVEATKDSRTEYWAVASHRDDALTIVRTQTSPDWGLVLTEHRLTRERAAELKMMHNTVLKLDEVASEIGYCAPILKSNGAPANRVVSASR